MTEPTCCVCLSKFNDDPERDDFLRGYAVCPNQHALCKNCIRGCIEFSSLHITIPNFREIKNDYQGGVFLEMTIVNNDGYNGYSNLTCPTCRHLHVFQMNAPIRFNWISKRHLTCTETVVPVFSSEERERRELSTKITTNTTAVQEQIASLMGALQDQQSFLETFQAAETKQITEETKQIETLRSDIDTQTKKLLSLKAECKDWKVAIEGQEIEHTERVARLREDIKIKIQEMERDYMNAEKKMIKNKDTLMAEFYRQAHEEISNEFKEERKKIENEQKMMQQELKANSDFEQLKINADRKKMEDELKRMQEQVKAQMEEDLREMQEQVEARIKARLDDVEIEGECRRKRLNNAIKIMEDKLDALLEERNQLRETMKEEVKKEMRDYRKTKMAKIIKTGENLKEQINSQLYEWDSCSSQFKKFLNMKERCITQTWGKYGYDRKVTERHYISDRELTFWAYLDANMNEDTLISIDKFFRFRFENMDKKKRGEKNWVPYSLNTWLTQQISILNAKHDQMYRQKVTANTLF